LSKFSQLELKKDQHITTRLPVFHTHYLLLLFREEGLIESHDILGKVSFFWSGNQKKINHVQSLILHTKDQDTTNNLT